jgi:hypothetical protein
VAQKNKLVDLRSSEQHAHFRIRPISVSNRRRGHCRSSSYPPPPQDIDIDRSPTRIRRPPSAWTRWNQPGHLGWVFQIAAPWTKEPSFAPLREPCAVAWGGSISPLLPTTPQGTGMVERAHRQLKDPSKEASHLCISSSCNLGLTWAS